MSSLHLVRRGKTWYTVLAYRDADGKRRQKSQTTGTTDKGRAEQVYAERLAQLRAGIRLEEDPTVADWLTAWVEDVTGPGAARRLAPNTVADYRRIVQNELIPAIGKGRLRDLRPADVQTMLAAMLTSGLARATVRYRHAILKASLHEAERQGLILRNAAALARSIQPDPTPQEALRAEDARRLVEAAAGDPWGPFVALALLTGLRRGELLGLQWGDVDEDLRALLVVRQRQRLKASGGVVERPTKSRSSARLVALPERAMGLLRAVRAAQAEESLALGMPAPGHVFAHRYRGQWLPWSPESADENVRRLYGLAGLPVPAQPMHALRHTHLTAVAAAGMSVRDAQTRAGHSDPGITLSVYTHATVEGQRAGAEAAAERLLPAPPPEAAGRGV